MSHGSKSSTLTGSDIADGEFEHLLSTPVESRPPSAGRARTDGALVGRVVAFTADGTVPLVAYDGQPGATAMPARTTLDLHAAHIGREVVLTFEDGDPCRPIVIGCIRHHESWPLSELPGAVEVDADGQRLVVSANEQLVLRCGKASITLTRAGKIIIRGAHVSSRSSGVNRIVGGSVQIN
jgi:hypothetical protein